MDHQPCFPPHVLSGSIQNNGAQNINPYQNLVNKKEELEYNTNLKGHSILTTSPKVTSYGKVQWTTNLASLLMY